MRAIWLRVVVGLLTLGISSVAGQSPSSRDRDHDYDAPTPGSYKLPVIKSAAAGSLVESNGRSVDLSQLTRGRVTILSFIYTQCAAPRACPYATNTLGQLQLASASDSQLTTQMRLVSVSFDPQHDTPQRLAEYADAVQETKAGCEWRFVTAKNSHELQRILNGYDQAVDTRPNPNDPQGPLYHVVRVFLIDSSGKIRNIYSSGTLDPRLVLADVKTLLLEQRKSSTP